MKKYFVIALLASVFIIPSVSSAAISDAGLLPDSSFYFLKLWKESIQLFFTFNAENKAKQYLHLAEVRLAEYQKMLEKGKNDIAEKTLTKYQNQLNRALAKAEEIKQKGKDVKDLSSQIEQVASKHLEILQENLAKVPEQAKKGIENAIENSQKEIERVLEMKINEEEENNEEEQEKSKENNETSNWKTYRNEQWGFEFKYPINWYPHFSKKSNPISQGISVLFLKSETLPDIGATEGFAYGDQIIVNADFISRWNGKLSKMEHISKEEYLKEYFRGEGAESSIITTTTINGLEWLRVERMASGSGYRTIQYLHFKNDKMYSFYLYPYEPEINLALAQNYKDFQELISTFKFIQ